MSDCARDKHDYGPKGRREPFCLLCGHPNPRCVECGRLVLVTHGGAVRCVKGHTHRLAAVSDAP